MTLYIPKAYLKDLGVKSGELNRDKNTNMKVISYDFTEEGGKDNVPVLVSMLIRTTDNKVFRYEKTQEPFTYSCWMTRIEPYELEKGVFLVLVNLGDILKKLTKCDDSVFAQTLPIDHGFIYSEGENKLYLLNHVIVAKEQAEALLEGVEGRWEDISKVKQETQSTFSSQVVSTLHEVNKNE